MHSLYWLVRLSLILHLLWNGVILRPHRSLCDLGNRNVSNCDLINRTALALREQFVLCLHDLEPALGPILSAGEPGRVCN